MAEEDLIYGQKRHMFGGIAPSNMKKFVADYDEDTYSHGLITAVLPDDTVIDGQTLCTVGGAVIRRKLGSYPENEFDGELFADIKTSMVLEDDDFADARDEGGYYYAAFPYSTQGVYNRNPVNRAVFSNHYVYGYDLNVDDPNPETRVSYPDDVDNYKYKSAKMNFGGSFDYGDWPSRGGTQFMPKPCMLTYEGKVRAYLNPIDYGQIDSGDVVSVTDMSVKGNAMMEWNKIYTKRWEENGIYHFRCSDIKVDEDYECWCNYDKNNKEIGHFYTPIYSGCVETIDKDSGLYRMRSMSGQENLVSIDASMGIMYAQANGDDWYTEVLADRLLINDLLTMIGKSTDHQSVFGYGVTEADGPIVTGTMDTKGLFWGSDDGTSGVKVFGMENYWGNINRRVAGWMCSNGTQLVKLTRGTKDGSTAEDYNITGEGYISLSDIGKATNGYISKCATKPYGRIPCTGLGSDTTYECDKLYVKSSGLTYARVGGYYSRGSLAGSFYLGLGAAPSSLFSSVGAALSCKPLAS